MSNLHEPIRQWIENTSQDVRKIESSSEAVKLLYADFLEYFGPSIEEFERALFQCGFTLICDKDGCRLESLDLEPSEDMDDYEFVFEER